MRVRVTMEAEVGDLPAYWPDDPKERASGVTIQNVGAFVGELRSAPLERKLHTAANKDKIEGGQAVFDALMEHYRQDAILGQRLMEGIRVELVKP